MTTPQNNLQALFKSRGFTSKQVAERLHVNPSNVTRICNGSRPLGERWAMAIAEVLNVQTHEVWAAYEVRALPRYKRENPGEGQTKPGVDLKTLIALKGKTFTSVALLMGVTLNAVSQWARGIRALTETREGQLAAVLKVDPSEIRQAYEQRALPQFKRQSSSSPDEASLNGQKPPQGSEVASRSA